MDDKEVLALLPQVAPEGLVKTVIFNNPDQFEKGLLIYHRVNVQLEGEPTKELMLPEDWDRYYKGRKSVWAAHCHCTLCGEDWISNWMGGSVGIVQGPDGCTYPGIEPDYMESVLLDMNEGDTVNCPICERELTVTRKSGIRRGRNRQLMAYTLETVGRYTALIYYLVTQRMGPEGIEFERATPMYATLVDDDGTMVRFSRANSGGYGKMYPGGAWKRSQRGKCPEMVKYHSAEACNEKKVGARWAGLKEAPQGGKTGEKTGLAEYLAEGGLHPEAYLEFWRANPNIENLVKAGGWVSPISEALDDDYNDELYGRLPDGSITCMADWDMVKPHEMLRMTKEEFRRVSGRWDKKRVMLWWDICQNCLGGPGDVEALDTYISSYGVDDVAWYIGEMICGEAVESLYGVDRYLQRQKRRHDLPLRGALRLWLDYVDAAQQEKGEELSQRELWPEDLMAEHNAQMEHYKGMTVSPAAFEAVYQKWKALEWSDGDICIRLPRSEQDLITEGDTLDHCVGTYGADHVGEKLVLFVRHTRRPERSWYTLNIDVRTNRWSRIQLHGYGNEYNHKTGRRLHIDKRVLAFCDRWEREVLDPVFRKVKAGEQVTKISQKKKKEVNAA